MPLALFPPADGRKAHQPAAPKGHVCHEGRTRPINSRPASAPALINHWPLHKRLAEATLEFRQSFMEARLVSPRRADRLFSPDRPAGREALVAPKKKKIPRKCRRRPKTGRPFFPGSQARADAGLRRISLGISVSRHPPVRAGPPRTFLRARPDIFLRAMQGENAHAGVPRAAASPSPRPIPAEEPVKPGQLARMGSQRNP